MELVRLYAVRKVSAKIPRKNGINPVKANFAELFRFSKKMNEKRFLYSGIVISVYSRYCEISAPQFMMQ